MSRLTNNNNNNPILKNVGHANCKNVCEHEMCCDMCPIQEAIEKLAHYEDLEEQGRLIEVIRCKECEHCSVGRSLYFCEKEKRYTPENGYCSRAKLRELDTHGREKGVSGLGGKV